ncbi:hypothetical protein [Diaphorobacter caeni]|uniref:hypothetical protein n=1 Tax=Diaphorobacter caeni TaxID=2784387 RepID=UPI00188F264D|nr:hypothetical protein [Diaphorobacter caeni]MBF5006916.1 hypothetical protein [Diaphorobacter caeni]
MNIEQVSQIIERLERSTVDDFEVEVDGFVLRGHFSSRAPSRSDSSECPAALSVSSAKPAALSETTTVKSPSMGIFTTVHPLTQATYSIDAGRNVAAEEILGFIILGSAIQPVLAPKASILHRSLVEDKQIVGYGQSLFELG